MDTQTFHLLPTGRHNVRDLGGLPVAGGGSTKRGRVVRACAMQHIGAEGRAALIEAGLRTVIDLRSEAEAAIEPPPFLTTRFVNTQVHPVFSDLAPIASMIEADASGFRLQHRYTLALHKAAPRFAGVVRAVAEAEPGLIVVHCTAGKDRTGIVAALLLELAGVEHSAIVEDYARTADHGAALIDVLRARAMATARSEHSVETILACPAEAMEQTLVMLGQEFGGARGYLEAAGLGADVLGKVRDRLVS